MAPELEIMQHHDKMCVRARDTHRRIIEDDNRLLCFARASQNIAMVVALLRRLLEPTTPKGRLAQHEIHPLLQHTVVQQAESLAS
jgi:hypothetical protein